MRSAFRILCETLLNKGKASVVAGGGVGGFAKQALQLVFLARKS